MSAPTHVEKSESKTITGIRGISQIAYDLHTQAHQSSRVLLAITANNNTASQLKQSLDFFQHHYPEPLAIDLFPDWETLPYDQFSPHQDIVSQRIRCLQQLSLQQKGILISPVTTIMQRLAPTHYLAGNVFSFTVGQHCDLTAFKAHLLNTGYLQVNQVMEHGEFAIRGSMIDLYPMGSSQPLRIDLFDNDIDSIRTFDTETQRSEEKRSEVHLLPAHEFPIDEAAITRFRQQWRQHFPGNPSLCPLYEQVSQGQTPAGIDYYLPLFFDTTTSLLDYLPKNSAIIRLAQVHEQADRFWQEIKQRYDQRAHDVTRPILPPQACFWQPSEIFQQCRTFATLHLPQQTQALPDLAVNHQLKAPLQALQAYRQHYPYRLLFCADSRGREQSLRQLLAQHGMEATPVASWSQFKQNHDTIAITHGHSVDGFQCEQEKISLISETELFGEQVLQQRRRKQRQVDSDLLIKSLAELQMGSPVVHIDHGVGRYQGLQTLSVNNVVSEFLTLSYAGHDKIYVPVTSLHLIGRYTGSDGKHAPLNRLGSDQWQKAKRKASAQVSDVAVQLLDIYARREARQGFAHQAPHHEYQQFAANFPFELTPDQEQAIEQVTADMTSKKPMDRLICGDVGFGKTEVAMRAAFIACQSEKQVAILVPTTLLASQHFQNFSDRFADVAVTIELLSRFRTTKEQQQTIDAIKSGHADIIIGTHKLLQKNIHFANLGLLIIDEEHRFGVKQKEHIKAMRSNIDVLSMTATPIPRTLNMSLAGMRDISIISTPPAKRLAIKTFCQQKHFPTIREAVLREIYRGGQVFYLHNNIDTITKEAERLREILPEANLRIAHGQMRERELENIMADFYHQRFNMLVCTTIIENGIDIPTANTMIIDRADHFGLAQLHQLRGRVGRSHHQAYAYLFCGPRDTLTHDAKKRLDAIVSLEDLGAGFILASHDLEIRGAGELLGEQQSGSIQAIGFTLYMEMLERAVKALKSGKQPELEKPLHQGCEINLHVSSLIPENYVADIHQRLTLYKRIANAADEATLDDLQVEFIDRFGLLPEPTKHLFATTSVKLLVAPLGIKAIDASDKKITFSFIDSPPIDPMKLVQLVQQQPQTYQLTGTEKFIINQAYKTLDEKISAIQQMARYLSQDKHA